MNPPSTNTKDVLENRFIAPENWFEVLNWSDWFACPQPIEVDLGAGDGGFISERAKNHPHVNFLAVERLLGRARKIDRKARRLAPENLRVVRMETLYTIKWLIPPHSVQTFYLLFPDPWPKKKHHKHRIIRGEFLGALEQALEPGGALFAATDHAEYFQEIHEALLQRPGWTTSLVKDEEWFAEKTDFERHFLSEGKKIGRLKAIWKG